MTAVPARRRTRPPAGDAGMTLSEVVVVMMIGSVVLTLVAGLTIGLVQGNARNLARQGQVDEARSAVLWLSRGMGQAVAPSTLSDQVAGDSAVVAASGSALTFYSNIDNPTTDTGDPAGPTLVTFRVDDGVLRRVTQRPDPGSTLTGWTYTCDATACPDRHEDLVVARGVADRLFRYVDGGGSPLPPDGSPALLTAAELAAVDAIEVSVVVESADPAGSSGPTTVLRRIALPDWSRF